MCAGPSRCTCRMCTARSRSCTCRRTATDAHRQPRPLSARHGDHMTTIVYAACAGPTEIHRFALDAERGALTPLDAVTVPGRDGASPSNLPMAFAPGHTTLYAALRT